MSSMCFKSPQKSAVNKCEHSSKESSQMLYRRPKILQLPFEDKGDGRPILSPPKVRLLQWRSGYAEVKNANKSIFNEDQAVCCEISLRKIKENTEELLALHPKNDYIRCYYWALFDGHGGHMASLMASEYLHRLIKVQLQEIMPAILSDVPPVHLNNTKVLPNDQSFVKDKHISMEQVVIGALEHAFQQCDDLMSVHMNEPGGCTALVVLSLQGRLYIANAGDSRAVLVEKSNVTQLTRDLTAENERQRIQQMAFTYPQLLGNEFTRYEFPRRLMKQEVGKKVLYRDYFMTGWGYKLIEDDDQKYPLIHGHGRQTRIMGTLAVSRCFGNHKLKVFDTNILVKPFLSCIPEVKMVAFSELPTDVNDVLIVATDGLWDVISNKEVGEIVRTFLSDNSHEPQRFSLLAEHLVSKARGTQNGYEWTQENGAHASYDDISVFVIPLCNRESS